MSQNYFPPTGAGQKRVRNESLSPTARPSAPISANFVTNIAFRPKRTDDDHIGKKQRGDPTARASSVVGHGGNPTAAGTTASFNSVNTIASASPSNDATNASSALIPAPVPALAGTIAQRLKKRRKSTAIDPFVSRSRASSAQPQRRSRRAPIAANNSLLDADEAQLAVALQRRQTNIVRSSDGLPVAHVKNESKITRPRVAKSIKIVTHCLCQKQYDGNMVVCTVCDGYFHPFCVGKGLQPRQMYDDEQLSSRAYMRDAEEFGKTADFVCAACNRTKYKGRGKKFTWAEGQAENVRRGRIFQQRLDVARTGANTRICDHYNGQIVGNRYECKHCEGFDLCQNCYVDPAISSMHQHADDDMVLK